MFALHVAVGQNQWCHFGVGAPPILVYFSGDWDVHWGYCVLTHGHVRAPIVFLFNREPSGSPSWAIWSLTERSNPERVHPCMLAYSEFRMEQLFLVCFGV